MKRISFLFVVIAIVFISCGSGIKEGEIIEKEFHRAHVSVVMMPIVTSTGKTTITHIVPMTFFYPDSWHLKYQQYNAKTEKWDSATVWVNKETFDSIEVGAWYERTEDAKDKQPRIRQK